ASRPGWLLTKTAKVLNHFIDLIRGQRVAESGHDLREAARGTAIADDRLPGVVVLGRGLVAEGEIREGVGLLEAYCGLRLSLAVGTVTGDAGGFVDFLAGVKLQGGSLRVLGEYER